MIAVVRAISPTVSRKKSCLTNEVGGRGTIGASSESVYWAEALCREREFFGSKRGSMQIHEIINYLYGLSACTQALHQS